MRFLKNVNVRPLEENLDQINMRKTMLIPTKYQHTGDTAVLQMKEIEETEETLPQYVPQDDIFLSLVHVALKIRGDMMQTPGHKGFSVSEDQAIPCIPDNLYMLLRLIVLVKSTRRRQF